MFCCGAFVVGVIGLFIIYKVLDYFYRSKILDKLDQRYILVTGCDSGFGNLLVKRLDRLGCHVFAGCYTDSAIQELSKSCSVRLHALPLDVTKPDSIREALKIVKEKLPPGRGLWALMNNAGLMGAMGPPEFHTMADYRFVTDVNLFGLIDVTMTFLPLIKQARGRVVSTSSIAGRLSSPGCVPYNVSKYGVEAFMDGMRRAMHIFGVKCSLIEPRVHNTTFWTQTSTQETVKHTVTKKWEELPLEAREEYGKEYFDFISTYSVKGIMSRGSNRFEDVVDAYEHAILGRYPRARYLVGRDARTIVRFLIYAPESVSDWVMRKRAGNKCPLPEALRKK